jgi:ketosteroid isomerase-like protein
MLIGEITMYKTNILTTLVLLNIFIFITNAFSEELPSVTLPPELQRVLTEYENAWQKKDAKALAALFTEDGFVLSSGNPPVRGRAEIEKHYSGSGGPLALHAFAYETEGSIGYIIGGFSRQKGQPDIGKFTLTLRKGSSDIRWLIVSDMDNDNKR